jgi:hypothetical protein
MVFARNEMEYLGSIDDCGSTDGESHADPAMIDEMWHRLDALRRHDQDINASDWRPRAARHRRPPISQRRRS